MLQWRSNASVQVVSCVSGTSSLKVLVGRILVAGHLHGSDVAFLRAGRGIKTHLDGHVRLSVAMTTHRQDADGNHNQNCQRANHQADRQSSTETVHSSLGHLLNERLQTVDIGLNIQGHF